MNRDVSQDPGQLCWRKSSYSQGENTCVEVACAHGGGRWLRDTKNRSQAAHYLTAPQWAAFLKSTKDGAFA